MNFTAIYNTEKIKNIEYSFSAENQKSAIAFCKRKFKKEMIITLHNDDTDTDIFFPNLAIVRVSYRTGGTKRSAATGLTYYNSTKEEHVFQNADELFAQYPPVKMSDKLREAVEDAFAGVRDKVEYNFGKGNALFFFS